MATSLSVIIPVGPRDLAWKTLLTDLGSLPGTFDRAEVILVRTLEDTEGGSSVLHDSPVEVRWLKAESGRAKQMNEGARAARGEVLWFLHADSRFRSRAIEALFEEIQEEPDALHFFNLAFQADGPVLTQLNTLGVWFRSRLLGIPFGDQGFFLSREIFQKLGGFNELADFGEDHLLVWRARRMDVPLCCSNAWISTSARKYRDQGWGKTTAKHLFLTAWQGAPEFVKWVWSRLL